MAQQEMNAMQRAQLFAMSTRQNMHMLAKESANTAPSTLEFNLPKNRLLSSLLVRVTATVTAKGNGTATYKHHEIGKLLRRISLDLNNGFMPFNLSGEEISFMNMIDINGDVYSRKDTILTLSTEGTENTIEFVFELPNTLNGRDATGLILLQNDQTNVRLTLDVGNLSEFIKSPVTAMELKKVEAEVMTTTYSIPTNAVAYPDLSVLKITNGVTHSMPSAGQQIIKLSTGQIYRKILFKVIDENNDAMTTADIVAPFELVFNQADSNYQISADMLRILNRKTLGFDLPDGVYMFDFSNAGQFPNFGGTRDYIDSSALTEMWLRFNTTKKGKLDLITETLSRLVGNA